MKKEDNELEETPQTTDTMSDQTETDSIETTPVVVEKKTSAIASGFAWTVKNAKWLVPVLLVIVLVVVVMSYNSRIDHLKADMEAERNLYQGEYQKEMLQQRQESSYQLAKVFSWSVRSELMRGNREQVDLLLNQFVKTSDLNSIALINPKDYLIELSTDKKLEGTTHTAPKDLKTSDELQANGKAIVAVLGINETIGYLEFSFSFAPVDSLVGTVTDNH